jgi:hypothetical protein
MQTRLMMSASRYYTLQHQRTLYVEPSTFRFSNGRKLCLVGDCREECSVMSISPIALLHLLTIYRKINWLCTINNAHFSCFAPDSGLVAVCYWARKVGQDTLRQYLFCVDTQIDEHDGLFAILVICGIQSGEPLLFIKADGLSFSICDNKAASGKRSDFILGNSQG